MNKLAGECAFFVAAAVCLCKVCRGVREFAGKVDVRIASFAYYVEKFLNSYTSFIPYNFCLN